MLKQAVDHYHLLLEDKTLAAESQQMLDAALDESKLIFGGRRLTPYLRPHFITEHDWQRVTSTCETIFGALQKIKDAAVEDEAILDELGITEVERELVRIDPGYSHVSPNARLDSFLTEDSYSYVELNGESPAGVAYADSATEIFKTLPVMKKFGEAYNVRGLEGRSKMLDTLLACYREFLGREPEERPTIAIIDLKDLPTLKEFELFREYFESRGYPAVICSPDELEFKDDRLSFKGTIIDIVYKRLLVNEYLPIVREYPAFLNAYRAGAICMVNIFRSKLVHKKAIFAVLTNPQYWHLFNSEEHIAINDHIPWTRKFREGPTTGPWTTIESRRVSGRAQVIDLVKYTRDNSHKLVLKPNDDYGGHGIYIGWNVTAAEWDDAIDVALNDGDYLVQERVKTAKEMFPMITDDTGHWTMVEQLVDLDPLLFLGKVGSAFTRLSSSELANVSSGGGMVPTFIIENS